MTLAELQARIDGWISQFEIGYWHPLANLARLTEEVGELSRELNHRFGPKQKKSTEDLGDVAQELGDIVFTAATLANDLGIDLTEVLEATLRKVETRDGTRWKRA